MSQSIVLKANAKQIMVWSHNWLTQKIIQNKLGDFKPLPFDFRITSIDFRIIPIEGQEPVIYVHARKFFSDDSVFSLKCYGIGELETQVLVGWDPGYIWLFGVFWQEICSTFEVIERQNEQVIEPPKPPEPKKQGGKIDLWLDWYHAMLGNGYKCTLEDVASKSGYSLGYIKQRHMVYQAKPNQKT